MQLIITIKPVEGVYSLTQLIRSDIPLKSFPQTIIPNPQCEGKSIWYLSSFCTSVLSVSTYESSHIVKTRGKNENEVKKYTKTVKIPTWVIVFDYLGLHHEMQKYTERLVAHLKRVLFKNTETAIFTPLIAFGEKYWDMLF